MLHQHRAGSNFGLARRSLVGASFGRPASQRKSEKETDEHRQMREDPFGCDGRSQRVAHHITAEGQCEYTQDQ